MIVHPENIRYHLEKALYLAVNGRPGPVWLDIPLDVQGAVIETDDLKAYDPEENPEQQPREIKDETVEQILDKLQESKRPVLSPGNGVRLAGAHEDFYQLAELLGVPVVTGMSSVDAIESDHPLFVGRSGEQEQDQVTLHFRTATCFFLLAIVRDLHRQDSGIRTGQEKAIPF